jgi:hypothetical protein
MNELARYALIGTVFYLFNRFEQYGQIRQAQISRLWEC